MRKYRKTSLWVFFVLLSFLILEISCTKNIPATTSPINNNTVKINSPLPEYFHFPMDEAGARVTKKTFWLKVSPKNSPVFPEKFTGYHTGADFETFTWEKDVEVSVRAICTGLLVLKKWATGYGGVVVQKCELNKETVTIVYGHLKIESVRRTINTQLKTGDIIGILGKWYSSETNGERKHLHLGIHKWSTINIRGYTATSQELNDWLDPIKYLQ